MAQATPFKPTALVVEDDELQREMVAMLLEESEMGVIQCESAEAALLVLDKMGGCISMIFADVNLAGRINGIELAHAAKNRYPNMHVIVTSGTTHKMKLPEGAAFIRKPWRPLDVLREAERSQHH
jgi:DNA-binding NtrC family response regulator